MSPTRNILISVPNNNPRHVVYLPTIWATLKTHCRGSAAIDEGFEWLAPIVYKGEAERLLEPYAGKSIDVLGLSCYSWNANTNLEIAQLVRRDNPNSLIVVGGPHIDWRHGDFFAEHPYVDAIVRKDGEVPFKAMLEQLADDALDLTTIPGLVLPPEQGSAARVRLTADPQLPTDFERSPWLDNAEYLEQLIREIQARGEAKVGIPWEIDRGCPYHCSFCDWGSNTNSKVRSFPLERLRAEADWIARNHIHVAFITVANFGIVAQDEQVLEAIIAGKREHGFPRVFIWNNAKNNVDRVARMNERAYREGLVDYHILSVQSLEREVLDAMGRPAVDITHLERVIEYTRAKGIPCVAQLIFGAPNDDLERFVGSLTGLMELGVHDEYVAYPFDILPNAPANDDDFQRRWGIRTVTRKGSVNRRDRRQESHDMSTIIVATERYDEHEFVEMYVRGRLLIALHNGGVTQFIARYLRRVHGLSYQQFYHVVHQRLFAQPGNRWADEYARCLAHIAAFIGTGGEEAVESMAVEELPELDYLFHVEEYLLFKLLCDLEDFYDCLEPVLERELGPLPQLHSLRRYQQTVMIDPSYDRRRGRRIALEHDWPAFFAEPDNQPSSGPRASPCALVIERTHSGSQFQHPLHWFERPGAPLQGWALAVIGKHYQRVKRSYFADVPATPAEQLRVRAPSLPVMS